MAPPTDQVITLSLLRYRGLSDRWWAFTQMGLAGMWLGKVPGLEFGKLLGSGGGNGFSIWPNFGVYAFLGAWTDEAAARRFFAGHAFWSATGRHAAERLTVFLRTTMAHGRWDGREPFAGKDPFDPEQPVAVITRATIRPGQVPHFWRYVPGVSAAIKQHPDCRLSIGIGEYPLFMQATFSLWSSGRAMQDFAYRRPQHREVVNKTRQTGWFREELFARFHMYAAEGTWEGKALAEALFAPQRESI